jgi:glycosyltransferase involved in cell wall biosynthesis
MRRPDTHLVAVSSFTSGALSAYGAATVLTPGIQQEWFETLVEASIAHRHQPAEINLLTVFRLGDWRDKGLPECLEAIRKLGRSDIRLTVCGSGEPPTDLLRLIRQHSYCVLLPGLTDHQLAEQLASADLFVLATRTRKGRRPSGEGFGLVLLEAQLAGTPVVAPAFGGSYDSYIDGITGLAPTDESPDALMKVIDQLLRDRSQLTVMSKRATEWAQERFAPKVYSKMAIDKLL